MRAHILVARADGRRGLYIPEAHIQLFVQRVSERWIISAYRTDGYYGPTREEAIPTVQHLQQAYQFTAELEVPQHIADFAVKSEQMRQASVEAMAEILERAVKSQNKMAGFRDFMASVHSDKLEKKDEGLDQDAENRIGEEIHTLMTKAGGLQ
jgi:hypothetical protein